MPGGKSEDRTYIVLEEAPVGQFILATLREEGIELNERAIESLEALDNELYRKVATSIAKNAEGALRAAGKQAYDTDGRPMLVAVPERNFQPTPVTVGTRRTVTVG